MRRVLVVLLLLALASLAVALCAGSVATDPLTVLRALTGKQHGLEAEIVLGLRLPRALGAFACGGLLALAGVLMQVLLRNPLADPYVLGVSGGASVAALLALLAGASLMWVQGAAFVGALLVMLMVLGLAHGPGPLRAVRMLLTGVIVASGCAALIALILSIAPPMQLPGMLFWLMGDASQVISPWPAWCALLLAVALTWPLARELNLLAGGARSAWSLGVPVARVQKLIYVAGSLMTAVAVTHVGAVGFVGLIVPHALRIGLGSDHRLLLPASALAGGSVLSLADTLARTLASPHQLPVGVIMALVGVPVFLWLLRRSEQRP